jgi:hypothetical protein
MSHESETQGPARFREIADTLRGIARQIQYDLCRIDQLHALAAGFDRLADRVERDAKTHSADWNGRERTAAPWALMG